MGGSWLAPGFPTTRCASSPAFAGVVAGGSEGRRHCPGRTGTQRGEVEPAGGDRSMMGSIAELTLCSNDIKLATLVATLRELITQARRRSPWTNACGTLASIGSFWTSKSTSCWQDRPASARASWLRLWATRRSAPDTPCASAIPVTSSRPQPRPERITPWIALSDPFPPQACSSWKPKPAPAHRSAVR